MDGRFIAAAGDLAANNDWLGLGMQVADGEQGNQKYD
jgi:hypothetical protein